MLNRIILIDLSGVILIEELRIYNNSFTGSIDFSWLINKEDIVVTERFTEWTNTNTRERERLVFF